MILVDQWPPKSNGAKWLAALLAVWIGIGCDSTTRDTSTVSGSDPASQSEPERPRADADRRDSDIDAGDLNSTGADDTKITAEATEFGLPNVSGAKGQQTHRDANTDSNSEVAPKPLVIVPSVRNSRLSFLQPNRPENAKQMRDEAEALVQDVVKQFPKSPDAYEVKARFHLLVGENQKARESWEAALELDPAYGYAKHGLGKVALAMNNHEEAAEYLKVASTALPELAEAQHDLSDAYLKLGNVEAAINTLQRYADKHPDSTETLLLLGQAYMADKRFEPAKEAFEGALALYPGLPRAQEGLGRVLVRMGKREEAAELLKQQQEGRADEAVNRSAETVFQDELRDYCTRYLFAAQVYMAGGAAVQAEQVLEKAVTLDTTNTECWTALLSLYQRAGKTEQAAEMSRRMSHENPELVGAFFTAGILNAKVGKVEIAKESFEQVTELAPDSHSGFEALARLLIQTQSQPERLVDLSQKAVELRGSAADHELLAQAYAINEDYDRAYDSLKTAVELAPENTIYRGALGQLEKFRASLKE